MSADTGKLAAALADRYKIERRLGEGGMATVYLAEDLKHKRKVALKVLKPDLAAVLGAERFVQEITTTAGLQHPHILPLFDSGEADSFLYYVMPFIDGETLRDKLNRETQLGIEEAVGITTDIAGALDYAHGEGVIHRDIKPENILIHNGRPMVADFGIALAVSAAAGGRMTETGLSLGSPHYMSPEQATAEKDLTARSDIYSLGTVLYEMLAGEPPHTGASAQAVVMKIVAEDVQPVTELRKSVPPHVAAATAKALEKLPADRFESAAKFTEALANPAFTRPTTQAASVAGVPGSGRWNRLTVGFAGTTILLGIVAFWGWLRPPSSSSEASVPAVRASITDIEVRAALNSGVRMAISRDGSHIAVASFVDGVSRLFVRRSDQRGFQEIEGTEDALGLSFSPDGEWLAFMQQPPGTLEQGRISRVRVSGGPVLPVTDGNLPHWGLDDAIVFDRLDGIYRVSPNGGDAVRIVEGVRGDGWAHLLPDGRAVLFMRDEAHGRTILLADLETGTVTDLGLRGGNPQYVPTGHLVYGHESQALMAVPFDLDSHRVTGEPSTILPEVLVYDGGATQFAVSETGTAIYGLPGPSGIRAGELVILDLDGVATLTPLGEGHYRVPRFSPNGRWIAYGRDNQIWIYDRDLGENPRLTPEAGVGFFPATWSPDGHHVYFASRWEGALGVDVTRKLSDGSGEAERLVSREQDQYPLSTFGDGTQVLVGELTANRGWDLLVASEGQDGTTSYRDYLRAPWNELMGTISPNGETVAYVSDESGIPEVYVRSFPDGEQQRKVSDGGGSEPRWAPDEAAIYYLNGGRVMKVSVTNGEIGEHQTLFEGSWVSAMFAGAPVMTNWDVHPDGTSFVFVRNPRLTAGSGLPVVPVEVVVNWFEELKQRMGS